MRSMLYNIRYFSNITMKQKQQKSYIAPKKGKTKFRHFPIKEQVLNLLNENNFQRPTEVQAQSLPITLQQNLKELCVIVYAYNGAGKTLAYLIPLLNSLEMIPHEISMKARGVQEVQKKRPQGIIVFPTEALMSQVYEYLESYANYYEATLKWPLKIGRIYANSPPEYGHILVGLTKKISDLLPNLDLTELKWVIFDECDKIKDDSADLFKQILNLFSQKNVTANFLITSATGEKAEFRKFIQDNLTTHNLVELDSKDENMGLKGVTHYYSKLSGQEKINSIMKILQILAKNQQKTQIIIFFNEIRQLENFYDMLLKQSDRFVVNDPNADSKGKSNLSVDYVHARANGICKGQHRHPYDCLRSKTKRVERLRNGEIQVLLGTETIGRGIDIRTVSLVINFSEPTKNKNEVSSIAYIHRVGRTGRYSDEGIGLTFIDEATGDKFVKMTEQEQKIEFLKMESEEKIIEEALMCSKKNSAIPEDGKHRFEND